MTDIFAVESEVAQRIAESLEATLTGSEKAALDHIGTRVPGAYDAFLRAIALRNSQSREDQDRFIQFLRQAVALDPNYAEAWANLAFGEGLKFLQGDRSDVQRALTEQAAKTAARLDPSHGGGHAAMGIYLYYCLQDYDGALRELEQARQQAPNDPIIIQALGLVKRRQGKLDESIELQMQSARLDPLNQDIWTNIAWTYRGRRQFADAIAMFEHAHVIAPDDPSIIARQAEAELAGSGDIAKAARIYEGTHPPFASVGYGAAITVLVFQRRFDDAIARITADLQTAAGKIEPLEVARAHLMLGELHLAVGRAAEARPFWLQAENELGALREQGNTGPALRAILITVHSWLGRREDVERELADHIAQQAKDRWTGPLAEEDAARAWIILGEHDRALSILERLLSESVRGRDHARVTQARSTLRCRENPRFQKLAGDNR